MGMGSLGTHRKRERWQGQGWADKTEPVKEAWAARGLGTHVRISLVTLRPSRGAAERAGKDGTASLLSTVTIGPTSIMADSGQLGSPCSTTSCHTHSPHAALSVTPASLTQPPVSSWSITQR